MDGMTTGTRKTPETSLGVAMKSAGMMPARDRLVVIANEVLDKYGGAYQSASIALLARIGTDPALLWELMGNARERLTIEFLAELYVARKRSETVGREPERADGAVLFRDAGVAGHDRFDRPTRPSSAPKPAADPVRASTPVPAVPASRPPGSPRDATLRQQPSKLEAWKDGGAWSMEKDRQKSQLYQFQINGQPIAEVTAGEARRWAAGHAQKAWFVNLMIEGVPDAMLIGKARTPEEADNFYARAGEATRVN